MRRLFRKWRFQVLFVAYFFDRSWFFFSDTLLNCLTASFDEKLRLLLDPHYHQTSSSASASPGVRSVSLGSCSPRIAAGPGGTTASSGLGGKPSSDLGDLLRGLIPPYQELPGALGKKTELKRGRLVDKKQEPPLLRQSSSHQRQSASDLSLKRNNSLTKEEKQELNSSRRNASSASGDHFSAKESLDDEEHRNILKLILADPLGAAKYRKTLANQKRVRRRHTVGGTKDFAGWQETLNEEQQFHQVGDTDIGLGGEDLAGGDNGNQAHSSGDSSSSSTADAEVQETITRYAMQGISRFASSEEAFAAASRILDRQQKQLKEFQASQLHHSKSHGNLSTLGSSKSVNKKGSSKEGPPKGSSSSLFRKKLAMFNKLARSTPDLYSGSVGQKSGDGDGQVGSKNLDSGSGGGKRRGPRAPKVSVVTKVIVDRRRSLPNSMVKSDLKWATDSGAADPSDSPVVQKQSSSLESRV